MSAATGAGEIMGKPETLYLDVERHVYKDKGEVKEEMVVRMYDDAERKHLIRTEHCSAIVFEDNSSEDPEAFRYIQNLDLSCGGS